MTDVMSFSSEKLSKEGKDMPLINPNTDEVITAPFTNSDGEEVDQEMFITLLGPDSPEMQRQQRNIMKRLEKEKKQKKTLKGKDKKKEDEELEKNVDDTVKHLMKLTKGGRVHTNGEWVEGDDFLAIAPQLYRTVLIFRGQAIEFVNNAGNFIGE